MLSPTSNMNIDPDTNRDENESQGVRTTNVIVDEFETAVVPASGSSNTYERWSRLPKSRGRQPRDPHGQSVRFQCRETDDMENFLRDYLEAPTVPAEHATVEFVFPVSSAFMVYAADFKNPNKAALEVEKQQNLYGKLDRTAISVINALAASEDSKDQMRRQKAIAKVCVEACEKADGFRYSFHNNWLSREDEACRFSYFCNDSTLNKGRAANEGAGMVGKKMRKPVYDCQGLIAIKFSSTKQNLEVHYRHVPLHKTYAERAPPPRRDSKRRKLTEGSNSDSLPADKRKRTRESIQSRTTKKPRKRRATEPAIARTESEQVNSTREDSLQPLVEFLGATNSIATNQTTNPEGVALSQCDAISKSAAAPPMAQAAKRAHSDKPEMPAIPGTVAGSVQTGHLDWGEPPLISNKSPFRGESRASTRATELLPGISDAASSEAPVAASIALSELEALKRKLEEAEQRIKRLESEKTAAPPPLPSGPPQHTLWPPPPGYPHPYHYPYLSPGHSYPPHQMPPSQMRLQPPPQRPFPSSLDDRRNPTPSPADAYAPPPAAPASNSPADPPSVGSTLKPATTKPGPRKFVFFEPQSRPKQTPRASHTASSNGLDPGSNG